MKQTITYQEYLILEGLLHLARMHNGKMGEYWDAINELMDDEDDKISGYIFDNHPLTKILEWRGVTVEEKVSE